jgi:D-hydroxyproline dehydrogenase subunit beta
MNVSVFLRWHFFNIQNMSNLAQYDLIIVGAGIIGTSLALQAAERNLKVLVLEKNGKALGASIRNFGMVWPIGQPLDRYELAMRSAALWKSYSKKAGFWLNNEGSLLLADNEAEVAAIEDFQQQFGSTYGTAILTNRQIEKVSPLHNRMHCKQALFSTTECNIYSREALAKLHLLMQQTPQITLQYHQEVTHIEKNRVQTHGGIFRGENIVLTNGADLVKFAPTIGLALDTTVSKLQMMKTSPMNVPEQSLGPNLCMGLTLLHYDSFKQIQNYEQIRQTLEQKYPRQVEHGIHVLVSFTEKNELIIGDSHEYANEHDPFIQTRINDYILNYLNIYFDLTYVKITETWAGEYLKTKNNAFINTQVQEGIYVLNGVGGAGMTLSFGLTEQFLIDL